MRAAVLTVSDRSARGEREDASGPALSRRLKELGWEIAAEAVVADEPEEISALLSRWADGGAADLILTTGGTGLAARDVTPEATLQVIEREVPGLVEAIRANSLRISPHAMLSRARAGIRKNALIVNLPGSPRGALESLEVILPALGHAVQLLRGSADAEAGHTKEAV